jgi:hypothetical protein
MTENLFINAHKYPLLAEALKADDARAFYREMSMDDRVALDNEARAALATVQESIKPMIAKLESFAARIAKVVQENSDEL